MLKIADQDLITNFVVKNYPNDQGNDPIYLDMNKVRNSKSEDQEQPIPCGSKNGATESSQSKTTRYDWPVGETKKLLTLIKDKKAMFEDAKNKNSVWFNIAEELGVAEITGHQCRERYYTLKKAYRKFITDSNKSGNKRPKPFVYEDLMADIIQNDPTFSPVVSKGTLEVTTPTDPSYSDAAVDEESPVSHPKKKKTQIEDLKEYMQERDERFLEALTSMNEKQNKLMEKLIEKL